MRAAHSIEEQVGIHWYVSDAEGVGGRLRASAEDFRVREIKKIELKPLTADPGAYEHVVIEVTLKNWETLAFADELSSRLRISRERISWAGMKDKRAVSTQLFSIKGIDVDDIPVISNADLAPVGRFGRRLVAGDIIGNAFDVVISNPTDSTEIDTITTQLIEFGNGTPTVPNYFGHQRFGSLRPVTHEVGLQILRRNWKEAVKTYVGNPFSPEPRDSQAARRIVDETEDWKQALTQMPSRLRYERAILDTLTVNGGESPADFQEALNVLPQNLQRLFVHAAQSYLFNCFLSERLAHGLPFDTAVPGDVVCFSEQTDTIRVPDITRIQRVTDQNIKTVNRHVERGRAFVTAPLLGTDTELADGIPGEIERSILQKENVEPSTFASQDVYGSTGTRRPIALSMDISIAHNPLQISFTLPRGGYATVLLREYLKTSPIEL